MQRKVSLITQSGFAKYVEEIVLLTCQTIKIHIHVYIPLHTLKYLTSIHVASPYPPPFKNIDFLIIISIMY